MKMMLAKIISHKSDLSDDLDSLNESSENESQNDLDNTG